MIRIILSIISHDFYVDGLSAGADTSEEMCHIKEEISSLLIAHGFPLKKWIWSQVN